MSLPHFPIHGRGTVKNPPNRFETLVRISEPFEEEDKRLSPFTEFIPDSSRTIISSNDSPDVPFDVSLNPYRGCEHGCCYCYARPSHEYLGYSPGLDFEAKILVKHRAPELLREALSAPKWEPRVLGVSGVTDPYQPIERKLQITRRCLAVLVSYQNPVALITKNALVLRDSDLLAKLASSNLVCVFLSVTTLDNNLSGILEPRASRPSRRLRAIQSLTEAGVPTGVLIAPVIPGLTDMEIPSIVTESVRAGASFAGMIPLRLPYAVAPLFETWLEQHHPEKKRKILNRVREIRGGRLNDPRFGSRMRGSGVYAEQIRQLFDLACKKNGILGNSPTLSIENFRRESRGQMQLF